MVKSKLVRRLSLRYPSVKTVNAHTNGPRFMKLKQILTAGAISLTALTCSSFAEEKKIPDLTQTDPRGEFAREGKSFCGPVAVSNSLVWLFRSDLEEAKMSHYDLVNHLASENYMNTHEVKGTGASGVMRGVRQFLNDRKVKDYSLEFQGWRSVRGEFSSKIAEPKLDWIRRTLSEGGAVWLNLGWYRHDVKKLEYERVSGHWVTAVDFGKDESGNAAPNILIIHDPAPRAGKTPSREFVTMTSLNSGKLVGKTRNLPRPAKGLYRMEGGMHIKPSADCAILDAAVSLRLKSPAQQLDPPIQRANP